MKKLGKMKTKKQIENETERLAEIWSGQKEGELTLIDSARLAAAVHALKWILGKREGSTTSLFYLEGR